MLTHQQVRQMYSWSDVAERTERVYYDVLGSEPPTFIERLQKCVLDQLEWPSRRGRAELTRATDEQVLRVWEILRQDSLPRAGRADHVLVRARGHVSGLRDRRGSSYTIRQSRGTGG